MSYRGGFFGCGKNFELLRLEGGESERESFFLFRRRENINHPYEKGEKGEKSIYKENL